MYQNGILKNNISTQELENIIISDISNESLDYNLIEFIFNYFKENDFINEPILTLYNTKPSLLNHEVGILKKNTLYKRKGDTSIQIINEDYKNITNNYTILYDTFKYLEISKLTYGYSIMSISNTPIKSDILCRIIDDEIDIYNFVKRLPFDKKIFG